MLAIFTSRHCLDHVAPGGFPERPERLTAILDHLSHRAPYSGTIEEIDLEAGGEALGARIDRAVADVHEAEYVERFRRAAARGDGLLDSADNPLSAGTWDAARAAVAATLAATDWVTDGEARGPRLAFAAVRPPGHHAERGRAMGFCYFNNAAVAAQHAIVRHRARRVAIYDPDIHHGNGTQHLFEDRADVLYLSTHQYPFYPGTGAATEVGVGDGRGATVNVPLPAGTGDGELLAAVDEKILPAIARHGGDLLVLSAGFDAWRDDPLGGFRVTEDGYRELGLVLGRLAAERGGGRILMLLEGGYDVAALPALVTAQLDGLRDGLGID